MELDLNEFGKRYVTYTTYLFNGILVLGAVFIIISFFAPGETVGEVFLAAQIFSGIVFWLLPIAIVLAIIKRTRKVGGAMLYTIAVVQLAYWWITALLLLQDKGGTWWAVVGVVSSFVTAGFGIFAVTVLNAIIHGSLTGVLMFIGIPILCRLGMNLGKGLMEIHPEQVKRKIEEFEEKQQVETDELDAKVNRLEARQRHREKEIAELDEALQEIDDIEEKYDFDDEEQQFDDEIDTYEDDDDFDEEEFHEKYGHLTPEEIEAEIERLESEVEENEQVLADEEVHTETLRAALRENEEKLERAKIDAEVLEQQLRESQEKVSKARNDFVDYIGELVGDKKAGQEMLFEMYLESELPADSKDRIVQNAHRLWKQGDRQGALNHFNQALPVEREDVTSSDDAITLMNRGNLHIELGNFEDSILDLEHAARIDPNLPTSNSQVLKMLRPEDRENMRQRILNKDQGNQ